MELHQNLSNETYAQKETTVLKDMLMLIRLLVNRDISDLQELLKNSNLLVDLDSMDLQLEENSLKMFVQCALPTPTVHNLQLQQLLVKQVTIVLFILKMRICIQLCLENILVPQQDFCLEQLLALLESIALMDHQLKLTVQQEPLQVLQEWEKF